MSLATPEQWVTGVAGRDFVATSKRSAGFAADWIKAWIGMDVEWLRKRLARDFVQISPFGRLEGRENYLETVAPVARKSVQELKFKELIAGRNQAVIWFGNPTPAGVRPACEWVRVENGLIVEIQSFCDSATVREVLSSCEQENLGKSSRTPFDD